MDQERVVWSHYNNDEFMHYHYPIVLDCVQVFQKNTKQKTVLCLCQRLYSSPTPYYWRRDRISRKGAFLLWWLLLLLSMHTILCFIWWSKIVNIPIMSRRHLLEVLFLFLLVKDTCSRTFINWHYFYDIIICFIFRLQFNNSNNCRYCNFISAH